MIGLHHSDDPNSVLNHSMSPGVAPRDLTAHDLALLDMHVQDMIVPSVV